MQRNNPESIQAITGNISVLGHPWENMFYARCRIKKDVKKRESFHIGLYPMKNV